MEEYHPKVIHTPGELNLSADALSRLPMKHKSADEVEWEVPNPPLKYSDSEGGDEENVFLSMTRVMSEFDFEPDPDGYNGFEDTLYPVTTRARSEFDDLFPLSVKRILDDQLADSKLMKEVSASIEKKKCKYSWREVEGVDIIHEFGKILVPKAAKKRVLDWYHKMLVHPGRERMYQSIKINYTWSGLKSDCEKYCKYCRTCQISKKTNKKKYGLLPEKKSELTKWSRVNIDLWGPKKVCNKNGFEYEVHVCTMVDPTTGWFEACQLYGAPTAYRCQQILDTVWLARYPRPKEIGMDNGSEFKGVFNDLCSNMGLKPHRSNTWNPQSNSILERIHQVLADGLRAFNLNGAEIAPKDDNPFDD